MGANRNHNDCHYLLMFAKNFFFSMPVLVLEKWKISKENLRTLKQQNDNKTLKMNEYISINDLHSSLIHIFIKLDLRTAIRIKNSAGTVETMVKIYIFKYPTS